MNFFTHLAMFLSFVSIMYASLTPQIGDYPEEESILWLKLMELKRRVTFKNLFPKKTLLDLVAKINSLLLILF